MNAVRPVVVVGGGIAGLLAANWVQACGLPVVLIERADACGGLLRSYRDEDGNAFDQGTHVPAMTGDARVDRLLFDEAGLDWQDVPVLRVGNVFAGVLNDRSQFIDISALAPSLYQACFTGLLNSLTTDRDAPSLEAALLAHFGEPLARKVFFPLLRRFYVAPFDQLSASSHRFLGYGRVIAGSAEVCRELKRSAVYDAKVAFRDYLEGRSAVRYRYPRNGGVGSWVEALCERLRAGGGRILTGAQVQGVGHAAQVLSLANGERLGFEQLVWTAPLALLAKALGLPVASAPPRFLPLRLFHFLLDRPAACDCHYLYLNDPAARAFRITLYDNVLQRNEAPWRLTVEALDAPGETTGQQAAAVLRELRDAAVLAPGCEARLVLEQSIGNGFPEVTLAQDAANRELRERVLEHAPELVLCGRNASDAFFTTDVLLDTAAQLERRFGAPATPGDPR